MRSSSTLPFSCCSNLGAAKLSSRIVLLFNHGRRLDLLALEELQPLTTLYCKC